MARAFLFVLDSVGIGGAADAAAFGDDGANTVLHVAEECGMGRASVGREHKLNIPNLSRLGIGAACELSSGERPRGLLAAGGGVWGVGLPASPGKDTVTGHWELAGVPLDKDWGYFPKTEPCFPPALIAALVAEADLPGILGDKHASGTAILDELARSISAPASRSATPPPTACCRSRRMSGTSASRASSRCAPSRAASSIR